MNVLLIDDRASEGWEEILSKLLPINRTDISSEETVSKGIERVEQEEFDLIFLDLRFGEKDHTHHRIEEFGGIEILKSIKSDFSAINFATPVILFTATNKIWNVDFMIQNGVDSYYIKEHPNYSYDNNFTQKNYERLIGFFFRSKTIKRKKEICLEKNSSNY